MTYFYPLPLGGRMNFKRINTMIHHVWYHMRHSVETLSDLFWMPLMNTILFGFMVSFFLQGGKVADASLVLVGVILWYMVEVGSYSIAVGALWEIWCQSLSSLFVTPLTLAEFVIAHMLFSIVKQLLMFVFLSGAVFLFFHFSIFQLGWMLVVYLSLLTMFAWAVGMFTLSLILRFGTVIQSFAWTFIYLIQPVVGVYYPIRVLPAWLQKVAGGIPITYVFDQARVQYAGGTPQAAPLVIAALLNIIYLAASAFFLSRMWAWSKRTGSLVRMET